MKSFIIILEKKWLISYEYNMDFEKEPTKNMYFIDNA